MRILPVEGKKERAVGGVQSSKTDSRIESDEEDVPAAEAQGVGATTTQPNLNLTREDSIVLMVQRVE